MTYIREHVSRGGILVVAASLFLAVFFLALVFMNLAAKSDGPVQVLTPNINLGTISAGAISHSTGYIENRTNHTVFIDRVFTGCACTTVDPIQKILPKRTVPVYIQYTSSDNPGVVSKVIMIFLHNQPQQPVSITLQGNVIQDFALSPAQFWLGRIRCGARQSLIFHASTTTDFDLHAMKVVCPPNWAAAVKFENPRLATISASLLSPDIAGDRIDNITVHFNNNEDLSLALPIHYTVQSNYNIRPAVLNVGTLSSNQPASASALISSTEPLVLQPVSCPKGFSLILHRKSDTSYRISIRGTIKVPPKTILTSAVRLRTNNARERFIQLPLYGVMG